MYSLQTNQTIDAKEVCRYSRSKNENKWYHISMMSPHQQHLSTFRFVKWETVMVLLCRWFLYAFWSVGSVNVWQDFHGESNKIGLQYILHTVVPYTGAEFYNLLMKCFLSTERIKPPLWACFLLDWPHMVHPSGLSHCIVTLWYLNIPWPISLACLLHSETTSCISLRKYRELCIPCPFSILPHACLL